MTWPLVTDLRHSVADPGVPFFVSWILHWDWHAVHAHVPVFDANIFYPSRHSLLFSENLFGVAPLGYPLFALGAEPIFVHNVLLMLGIFLSGLGAWLFAYDVTGRPSASLVCGVIYAFSPSRSATLSYFQTQWAGFLPLMFLFLRRAFERGRWRDPALYGVFFVWNTLTCVYFGIFGALGAALTIVIEIVRRGRGSLAALGRIVAVSVAAAVLLSPLFFAYRRVSRANGFVRPASAVAEGSAGPKALISGGTANVIFRGMVDPYRNPEWQLFPGAIPIVLLLGGIALLSRRRTPRAAGADRSPGAAAWAIGMTLFGIFVSLGATTLLYKFLYSLIPGILGAIRDPARGYVLALLGIGALCSLMFARGWPEIGRKRSEAAALVVALIALAEFTTAPILFFHADVSRSPLSAWISAHPFEGGILEFPMKTADNIEYVYRATEHGHPIANGYSGFYPRDFVELTRAVEGAVDFGSIEPLLPVRRISVIAFHPRRATRAESVHFAALFRTGTAARRLQAIACARSRKDDVLIFEVADRPGHFNLEIVSPGEQRVAADAAEAFIANPFRYPPSAEALAYSWPDFW